MTGSNFADRVSGGLTFGIQEIYVGADGKKYYLDQTDIANQHYKDQSITFDKRFWRDKDGNEYQPGKNEDTQSFLNRMQQSGIELTQAGENELPKNYVEHAQIYRLADGSTTIVKDSDFDAFDKQMQQAAKEQGVEGPYYEQMQFYRVNGIEQFAPVGIYNEIRKELNDKPAFTQDDLLNAGFTADEILGGLEWMKAKQKQNLEELKRTAGKIGIGESEGRFRYARVMGDGQAKDGWDLTKMYTRQAIDSMNLGILTNDLQTLVDTYGGENGLELLKDRSALRRMKDAASLGGGWARLFPGGEANDIWNMSDEEQYQMFRNLKLKQEALDFEEQERELTGWATAISGGIDMGYYGLEFASAAAIGAAIKVPASAIYIGGKTFGSEWGKQMADKMEYDPLTGQLVKIADGRGSISALLYGGASSALEYYGEKYGAKALNKTVGMLGGNQIRRFIASRLGKEAAVAWGLSHGVINPSKLGRASKVWNKATRVYMRLYGDARWRRGLERVTGLKLMSPSGAIDEIKEELFQNTVSALFNLDGTAVDEDGNLKILSLSNARDALVNTAKAIPEMMGSMFLYSLAVGPLTRGGYALNELYGSKAALKEGLRTLGYDEEKLKGMSRKELRATFLDQIRNSEQTRPMLESIKNKAKQDAEKMSVKELSKLLMQLEFNHSISKGGKALDYVKPNLEANEKVKQAQEEAIEKEVAAEEGGSKEEAAEADKRAEEVTKEDAEREDESVHIEGEEQVKAELLRVYNELLDRDGMVLAYAGQQSAKLASLLLQTTRAEQDEIRHKLQNRDLDEAFNFLGNADIYDAMMEGMLIDTLAKSTSYQGSLASTILSSYAHGVINNAANELLEERTKERADDAQNAIKEFQSYLYGDDLETVDTSKEPMTKAFDEPDEALKQPGTTHEKNGVYLFANQDGSFSVGYNGTYKTGVAPELIPGTQMIAPVQVKTKPKHYSTFEEAIAAANTLAAKASALGKQRAELEKLAYELARKTLGVKEGEPTALVVVNSIFDDKTIFNQIYNKIIGGGGEAIPDMKTQLAAIQSISNAKGARLPDGRVVIFLNNIRSRADLAITIDHEYNHLGRTWTLSGELAKAVKGADLYKVMQELLTAAGLPIIDRYANRIKSFDDLKTEDDKKIALDETLAAVAEIVDKQPGLLARFSGKLMDLFREDKRVGGLTLTQTQAMDEVRAIVNQAFVNANLVAKKAMRNDYVGVDWAAEIENRRNEVARAYEALTNLDTYRPFTQDIAGGISFASGYEQIMNSILKGLNWAYDNFIGEEVASAQEKRRQQVLEYLAAEALSDIYSELLPKDMTVGADVAGELLGKTQNWLGLSDEEMQALVDGAKEDALTRIKELIGRMSEDDLKLFQLDIREIAKRLFETRVKAEVEAQREDGAFPHMTNQEVTDINIDLAALPESLQAEYQLRMEAVNDGITSERIAKRLLQSNSFEWNSEILGHLTDALDKYRSALFVSVKTGDKQYDKYINAAIERVNGLISVANERERKRLGLDKQEEEERKRAAYLETLEFLPDTPENREWNDFVASNIVKNLHVELAQKVADILRSVPPEARTYTTAMITTVLSGRLFRAKGMSGKLREKLDAYLREPLGLFAEVKDPIKLAGVSTWKSYDILAKLRKLPSSETLQRAGSEGLTEDMVKEVENTISVAINNAIFWKAQQYEGQGMEHAEAVEQAKRDIRGEGLRNSYDALFATIFNLNMEALEARANTYGQKAKYFEGKAKRLSKDIGTDEARANQALAAWRLAEQLYTQAENEEKRKEVEESRKAFENLFAQKQFLDAVEHANPDEQWVAEWTQNLEGDLAIYIRNGLSKLKGRELHITADKLIAFTNAYCEAWMKAHRKEPDAPKGKLISKAMLEAVVKGKILLSDVMANIVGDFAIHMNDQFLKAVEDAQKRKARAEGKAITTGRAATPPAASATGTAAKPTATKKEEEKPAAPAATPAAPEAAAPTPAAKASDAGATPEKKPEQQEEQEQEAPRLSEDEQTLKEILELGKSESGKKILAHLAAKQGDTTPALKKEENAALKRYKRFVDKLNKKTQREINEAAERAKKNQWQVGELNLFVKKADITEAMQADNARTIRTPKEGQKSDYAFRGAVHEQLTEEEQQFKDQYGYIPRITISANRDVPFGMVKQVALPFKTEDINSTMKPVITARIDMGTMPSFENLLDNRTYVTELLKRGIQFGFDNGYYEKDGEKRPRPPKWIAYGAARYVDGEYTLAIPVASQAEREAYEKIIRQWYVPIHYDFTRADDLKQPELPSIIDPKLDYDDYTDEQKAAWGAYRKQVKAWNAEREAALDAEKHISTIYIKGGWEINRVARALSGVGAFALHEGRGREHLGGNNGKVTVFVNKNIVSTKEPTPRDFEEIKRVSEALTTFERDAVTEVVAARQLYKDEIEGIVRVNKGKLPFDLTYTVPNVMPIYETPQEPEMPEQTRTPAEQIKDLTSLNGDVVAKGYKNWSQVPVDKRTSRVWGRIQKVYGDQYRAGENAVVFRYNAGAVPIRQYLEAEGDDVLIPGQFGYSAQVDYSGLEGWALKDLRKDYDGDKGALTVDPGYMLQWLEQKNEERRQKAEEAEAEGKPYTYKQLGRFIVQIPKDDARTAIDSLVENGVTVFIYTSNGTVYKFDPVEAEEGQAEEAATKAPAPEAKPDNPTAGIPKMNPAPEEQVSLEEAQARAEAVVEKATAPAEGKPSATGGKPGKSKDDTDKGTGKGTGKGNSKKNQGGAKNTGKNKPKPEKQKHQEGGIQVLGVVNFGKTREDHTRHKTALNQAKHMVRSMNGDSENTIVFIQIKYSDGTTGYNTCGENVKKLIDLGLNDMLSAADIFDGRKAKQSLGQVHDEESFMKLVEALRAKGQNVVVVNNDTGNTAISMPVIKGKGVEAAEEPAAKKGGKNNKKEEKSETKAAVDEAVAQAKATQEQAKPQAQSRKGKGKKPEQTNAEEHEYPMPPPGASGRMPRHLGNGVYLYSNDIPDNLEEVLEILPPFAISASDKDEYDVDVTFTSPALAKRIMEELGMKGDPEPSEDGEVTLTISHDKAIPLFEKLASSGFYVFYDFTEGGIDKESAYVPGPVQKKPQPPKGGGKKGQSQKQKPQEKTQAPAPTPAPAPAPAPKVEQKAKAQAEEDVVDTGLSIKAKPKGKLGKIGVAGVVEFAPGTKVTELVANINDDRINGFSELDSDEIVSDAAVDAIVGGILNASDSQTYGTNDSGQGVFENKEDFEQAMPALAKAGYYAVLERKDGEVVLYAPYAELKAALGGKSGGGVAFSIAKPDPVGESTNGAAFVPFDPATEDRDSVITYLGNRMGHEATSRRLKYDDGKPLVGRIDSMTAVRHATHFSGGGETLREAHNFAAKNILQLVQRSVLGYSYDDRKDNVPSTDPTYVDRWMRIFTPFVYKGDVYTAMITLRNYANKGYKAIYDIEEMEIYRGPIIPGPKSAYSNAQITAWGSRPLTANRIAQTVVSEKSEDLDTHPRMMEGSGVETFDPEAIVAKLREEAAKVGEVGNGSGVNFSIAKGDPVAAMEGARQWLETKFIHDQTPVFDAVRRVSGDDPLPDRLNVEAAAKNVHGKIRARQEEVNAVYVNTIVDLLKAPGMSKEVFDDYAMALHAIDRNRMIQARSVVVDPETGEVIDPGLEAGSGMNAREIEEAIARVDRDPNAARYRQAAELLAQMNRFVLDGAVRDGLLTEAQAKVWKRMSPHYVPLKSSTGPVNEIHKRATGRFTKADSVFINSVRQAHNVIRNGELNRVNKTMADWIRRFDPQGAQLGGIVIGKVNRAQVKMDDPQYVPRGSEAEEELREAKVPLFPTEDGTGYWVDTGVLPKALVRSVYRSKPGGPNVVAFWENGQRIFISFNGERDERGNAKNEAARLADALQHRNMVRWGDNDPGARFFNFVRHITRWKANISTSWNPNFIVRNAGADLFNTTNIMLLEGKGRELRRVYANYASALNTVKNLYSLGRASGNSEMERMFAEAMRAGAFTGTFTSGTFKDYDRMLKESLQSYNSLTAKNLTTTGLAQLTESLRKLGRAVDKVGAIPEMGMRLAVYKAMRESGWSQARAAQYAREITVDFNAKGEWTPFFNTLYMFSNAAAQSFVRYARAIKTSANEVGWSRAVTTRLVPVIGLNILLGTIAAMLLAGEGDDEDGLVGADGRKGSALDNIPDFEMRENLPIPLGDGKYLRLPTRGAMAPFVYLGMRLVKDGLNGTSEEDTMGDVLGAFVQANINFLGQSPTIWQQLAPTFMDPAVQMVENKDWAGRDIHRRNFGQAASKASMGYDRTPDFYKTIAKTLNEWTGGDDVRSGWADQYPEVYKLWTDFFLGSISQTAGSIANLKKIGSDFEVNDVPGLGGLVRQVPDHTSRYFEAFETFQEQDRAMRKYLDLAKESKDVAEKQRYLGQARGMAEAAPYLKRRTYMNNLNKLILKNRETLRLENQKRDRDEAKVERLKRQNLELMSKFLGEMGR